MGFADLCLRLGVTYGSDESIELMEKGVIHHIEGSMNGPLGDYCTQGKMRGMGVLRSHGGRYEEMVPLLFSAPLKPAYAGRALADVRNFDIFDFTVNGTTEG